MPDEPGRQSRDAHHEELVEIAGRNRQEPHSLEQRMVAVGASSRTRRLNCSQDNSRLMKRCGNCRRTAPSNSISGGAFGAGVSLTISALSSTRLARTSLSVVLRGGAARFGAGFVTVSPRGGARGFTRCHPYPERIRESLLRSHARRDGRGSTLPMEADQDGTARAVAEPEQAQVEIDHARGTEVDRGEADT